MRIGMKSLIGLMAVMVAACALNCGASSKELTRSVAEQTLQKQIPANANTVHEGDGVYGKREFVSLRDKAFYTAKMEVTGVRQVSATEAVVEWRLTSTAKNPETREWLDAFERLRARFAAMSKPQGGFSTYQDPDDGQKLVALAGFGQRATIFDSPQWKDMERGYERIKAIKDKGSWSTPSATATFALYDDGWRVTKLE